MTMTKAIISTKPDGIDVRVGYDDTPDATEEEKALAVELSVVLTEYLRMKKGSSRG